LVKIIVAKLGEKGEYHFNICLLPESNKELGIKGKAEFQDMNIYLKKTLISENTFSTYYMLFKDYISIEKDEMVSGIITRSSNS
jgi:hypothetical protein